MTTLSIALSLVTLALLNVFSLQGCGVKAPPTPILSAPPSPLQQEAEKRKQEKSEKEKKQKTPAESGKP
jgi:predicted small lipoprotein YifL